MKKSKVIFFLCLFWCFWAHGQNLVINGDFEEFSNCPQEQWQFEFCNNWYVPNISSPDYFRNCSNDILFFRVPVNSAGIQESFSGEAYAGLFFYELNNFKRREYIQGELRSPLKKGNIYSISFYISFADFSKIPCDRIGLKFTQERVISKKSEKEYKVVSRSNKTIFLDSLLLTDKDNWYRVEVDYLAKGNEKFFSLGLFKNDLSKKEYKALRVYTSTNPLSVNNFSYYYIDNVIITPKVIKNQ